jgi:hypothetical protein
LGEVSDGDPVKLTYERKLLTDTIKMCAYDVETQLMEMLDGVFRRNCSTASFAATAGKAERWSGRSSRLPAISLYPPANSISTWISSVLRGTRRL